MRRKVDNFNPFFKKIIILNKKIDFIFLNYKNISLSNSLSFEDLFLTYFLLSKRKYINIFLINTGRLFKYSIFLINKFLKKFKTSINLFYPNFLLINKYIKKYSLNGFYNNIFLRKICCHIRKINVLNNYLKNYSILITGQTKYHNLDRKNKSEYEYDYLKGIIKCNLLINWKFKEIFYFLEKFNIINNIIYDLGYFSIGCDPCTKISLDYLFSRKGRWWWEKSNRKECGLHI